MGDEMKKCNKCGKTKPQEEFNKNKNTPDKLDYLCKKCKAFYQKEYYIKNKKKQGCIRGKFVESKRFKICTKCGSIKVFREPYYAWRVCQDCAREHSREYYKKNKKKINKNNKRTRDKRSRRKYDQEYYQKNKSDIIRKSKEYYIKNKNYIKARTSCYRKKNKESIAIKRKEWREKNKESIAIKNKKYADKNREKMRALWRKGSERRKLKNPDVYKEYRRKNLEKCRAKDRERVKLLPDAYIRNKIVQTSHLDVEDIPTELIELERARLMLVREIRKEH